MILEAEPDLAVVGEAGGGRGAVKNAQALTPDVVLMDIRMPDLDGIEATRCIARITDGPRVLVLTTFDLDEYVYEALRAGASGFLLKAPGGAAARRDPRGRNRRVAFRPLSDTTIDQEFVRRSVPAEPPPGFDELSGRERDVLRLVARGLSNTEIAAELVLSEHTAQVACLEHPAQAQPT